MQSQTRKLIYHKCFSIKNPHAGFPFLSLSFQLTMIFSHHWIQEIASAEQSNFLRYTILTKNKKFKMFSFHQLQLSHFTATQDYDSPPAHSNPGSSADNHHPKIKNPSGLPQNTITTSKNANGNKVFPLYTRNTFLRSTIHWAVIHSTTAWHGWYNWSACSKPIVINIPVPSYYLLYPNKQ